MVLQKRYSSLTSESSSNLFKISIIVVSLLFLVAFFYGTKQIFNELREISEGQQELILKLTSREPLRMDEEDSTETEISGDVISKVDFIKFRNETRKKIRDLAKDLRIVQSKLRMKQTILDKY